MQSFLRWFERRRRGRPHVAPGKYSRPTAGGQPGEPNSSDQASADDPLGIERNRQQGLERLAEDTKKTLVAYEEAGRPAAKNPSKEDPDRSLLDSARNLTRNLRLLTQAGAVDDIVQASIAQHIGLDGTDLPTRLSQLESEIDLLRSQSSGERPSGWRYQVTRVVLVIGVSVLVGSALGGAPLQALKTFAGLDNKLVDAAVSGVAGAVTALLTPAIERGSGATTWDDLVAEQRPPLEALSSRDSDEAFPAKGEAFPAGSSDVLEKWDRSPITAQATRGAMPGSLASRHLDNKVDDEDAVSPESIDPFGGHDELWHRDGL